MRKIVHYANKKKFTHKTKYKRNKTLPFEQRTSLIYFGIEWMKEQVFVRCVHGMAHMHSKFANIFYQLFNAFHYFVCLLSTQLLNDPKRERERASIIYCVHYAELLPFYMQKHSQFCIDSQCSSFIKQLRWLVQNIDSSSGKYYSLCSCLIAFICLFYVFHGSDECLHFTETRQVPYSIESESCSYAL